MMAIHSSHVGSKRRMRAARTVVEGSALTVIGLPVARHHRCHPERSEGSSLIAHRSLASLGMTPFAVRSRCQFPKVSRHCSMTSGMPLSICSLVGWKDFTSADRLLALGATGTSGRIGTVKCLTSICEASIE